MDKIKCGGKAVYTGIENKMVRMIDYASAGKTWDKESMMEAWLKTE